ncbi:uncharacterized protein LOC135236380 isoform X1 [Anguilla rostrata]|uniref:U2A'/phosphoprotein 32 family A C-terminal domain-containing protein n=2 Tax=Anguilla anguilla TaxID=7936 RepID=A0A9D3LV95_ANGAN|nr:uncharacterized protein LOC118209328 isoform X1 [Anguilla anguilla]KAG5837051.1 hypothetical protein ANANG_G00235160 [Anguilla anguilla]
MSESSSGVVTNNDSYPKSHSARYSDLSDAHTSQAGPSRQRVSVEQSPDSGFIATPSPSSRFRFVSWYKLEKHDVRGDQLACPRVREGPSEEELFLRGEQNVLMDRRRGEEGQRWEERLQENWENCVELNLSYQDLGDPYQLENFNRILRRLIRVERLQLVDNALRDLSSIRLPRCISLNLHRNHLTSIRQLPKVPRIQHLCLSENSIEALGELALLGATPLQSLTLSRNPCEFLEDYRSRVFSCLPKLEVLDGIPKLLEDSVPPKPLATSRMCTIL